MLIKVSKDMEDLIPGYVERRKLEIEELRLAFQQKNFDQLKSIGHKIKGSAGGYELDLLGEYGAQLEEYSISKDIVKIEQVLVKIYDFIENLELEFC